jgi:hypothetical protein
MITHGAPAALDAGPNLSEISESAFESTAILRPRRAPGSLNGRDPDAQNASNA